MKDDASVTAVTSENYETRPGPAVDVTDLDHEFSPTLQAPVATALGAPWYLAADSPGGAYVTWLDLPGGRLGVCPLPAPDQTMRWAIALTDDTGNPLRQEHELAVTEPAEAVVARVRRLMGQWGIEAPSS